MGNNPVGTRHLPQSSSASRFTAGAFGFLNLSQSGDRPDLYREPSRFETVPSSPILQALVEHDMFVQAHTRSPAGKAILVVAPGADQYKFLPYRLCSSKSWRRLKKVAPVG